MLAYLLMGSWWDADKHLCAGLEKRHLRGGEEVPGFFMILDTLRLVPLPTWPVAWPESSRRTASLSA